MSKLAFIIDLQLRTKGGLSEVNATSRRAELIRMLRNRRKDTVSNLARDLGVCGRTIRRYVLTLTADEGYLIDTKRGRGGGVIYNGKKHPHKGIFSQEQIKVLNELKECADSRQTGVINMMLEEYA